MIGRIWHGWTTPANASAYEALFRTEILPGIAAKNLPGYRGAHLLRREFEGVVEFVTILWFVPGRRHGPRGRGLRDGVRAAQGAGHSVAIRRRVTALRDPAGAGMTLTERRWADILSPDARDSTHPPAGPSHGLCDPPPPVISGD